MNVKSDTVQVEWLTFHRVDLLKRQRGALAQKRWLSDGEAKPNATARCTTARRTG